MSDLPVVDREKLDLALSRNKRGPFGWLMWAANVGVSALLLWGVYSRVVETRFECVIISLTLLMYLEITVYIGSITVDSARHRDHRNAVHRHLCERLGIPLEAGLEEEIIELCAKSEIGAKYFNINRVAGSLLWWVALANLVRAIFFWA